MSWCNKPHPSSTWLPSEHRFLFSLVYHNWLPPKFATWLKPWVLSLLPVLSCILYRTVDKSKTRYNTLATALQEAAPSPLASSKALPPWWPLLAMTGGSEDALPSPLTQGEGSPAPAVLFQAKRRIETWCPTSRQSTVTAGQLCKAGQYQAASGFNRSDLTCFVFCVVIVFWCCQRASLLPAAWLIPRAALLPGEYHCNPAFPTLLFNSDFKLSIKMHNAHPCSPWMPRLKQGQQ